MSKSLIFDKYIYNLLATFESYTPPMELEQVKSITGSSDKALIDAISLINEVFNLDIFIEVKNEKQWICFPSELPEFNFKFSMGEWLSLLELRETQKTDQKESSLFWKKIDYKCSSHEFESLSKSIENIKYREEALSAPDNLKIHSSKIEKAIRKNHLIKVQLKQNEISVYPHKLIFVESEIHLVGEESSEHCLIFTPLANIKNIEIQKKPYKPFYSAFEVKEFIDSIMSLSDQSIRLVLKIKNFDSFDEKESSHFLGRPYVISNDRGETILAATVNKSQELIDWIISLGDSVEVLDPSDFKSEIQASLEELVYKKVS